MLMHDVDLFRIVAFEVLKVTGYSGCIGLEYDTAQVSSSATKIACT